MLNGNRIPALLFLVVVLVGCAETKKNESPALMVDSNKDGLITFDEFAGTQSEFDALDTDGDGKLSAEEAANSENLGQNTGPAPQTDIKQTGTDTVESDTKTQDPVVSDTISSNPEDTGANTEVPTDPTPNCAAGVYLAAAKGSVQDSAGAPMQDVFAQMCIYTADTEGIYCLSPTQSDAQGSFLITVPETVRCIKSGVLRLLQPGTDHVTLYCNISTDESSWQLDLGAPYVLHATTRATQLPDLEPKTAARTIVFEDGLELDLVPDNYYGSGEGYTGLAALSLDPSDSDLCFLSEELEFHYLYGFSPEGDVVDGGVGLRIPNTKNLAEGTKVKLYILGGLGCTLADGTTAHEGEWTPFGTGTVQGSAIVADSGSKMPCINWLAYGP